MTRNKSQSQRNAKQTTLIAQQSFYQGQLPPPEMMAHYKELIPDLPERIVKMAETEQKFRHQNENKTRKGIITSTYLGMIFAFLAVLVVSCIVVYAFYLGHPTQAAAIATGVIVSVAAVFIYRRRLKRKI